MTLARRHEITRLEAFSDAVFAFALTLLVVSLEAPKSYAELMHMLTGFLMGPAHWAYGEWNGRQRTAFLKSLRGAKALG
jgi:transmembrane protein TMEM174 (potassium channel)